MLAVLTFGLVALANPVTEKRQTDPLTLVTSLQTKVTGLTSQLQGISTASPANTILAESLVTQIISSVQASNAQAGAGSLLKKRQSDAAVAAVVADIVSNIGTTFTPVLVLVPGLSILIVDLDVALQELLVELDILVVGLTVAVSALLLSVSGVLASVGLGLVLGTLGL